VGGEEEEGGAVDMSGRRGGGMIGEEWEVRRRRVGCWR